MPAQNSCYVCIMDDTDPDIIYSGEQGCNHCINARRRIAEEYFPNAEGEALLARRVETIRDASRKNQYDCVVGISGGVDSSYVALRAKKLGLRVLAVHLDNGWNSELAVKNIENIVVKLGIDLVTHVIRWEEIKDLQRAYFEAGVVDVEAITDHAIFAVLYHQAAKHNIRYILSGSNVAGESIMPTAWSYDQRDVRNLKAIHKRYGRAPLKTFPLLSPSRFLYYVFAKRIKFLPILNYMPYVKTDVMEELARELDWKPYPNKHGESRFTRFFQDYYLPTRFSYDKRKAHYSSLIAAGQMAKEDALAHMNKPAYRPEELDSDLEFVLKKLEYSREEWQRIMQAPTKKHLDFPNNYWMFSPKNGITRYIKRYAKAGVG
ncbi:MAG: N-acetyl sugar amidotransferase [Rickettsiales bacterium]|nr:N-acetyl sugar amidotransferase [Rickettsiales bacterium]